MPLSKLPKTNITYDLISPKTESGISHITLALNSKSSTVFEAKLCANIQKTLLHGSVMTAESHSSEGMVSCDSTGLWLTLFHCSTNHSRPLWLTWGETTPPSTQTCLFSLRLSFHLQSFSIRLNLRCPYNRCFTWNLWSDNKDGSHMQTLKWNLRSLNQTNNKKASSGSIFVNSCCAAKHCSNPQSFKFRSWGEHKVYTDTKYVRMNFGVKSWMKVFLSDSTPQPWKSGNLDFVDFV